MTFTFNEESTKLANLALAKYPDDRKHSAVMPFLDIAQRQNDNWLSQECVEYVANQLDMPYIKVWEIVTFYSMYNTQPVGKNLIQVCRTSPCWLRGSNKVTDTICKQAKCGVNETSEDNLFTVVEVECLGACSNGPVVQINNDFFEDLDEVAPKKS